MWRAKDKTYFDNASLIDSDSFQVSCRFPNLLIRIGKQNVKIIEKYVAIEKSKNELFKMS